MLTRNLRRLALLFLPLFLLLLFSACGKDGKVTVMLTESEGFSVESKNPQKIKSGGDATFTLRLDDGCRLIQLLPEGIDYFYDGETLTIRNVRYPLTVEPVAAKGRTSYRFSLQNLSAGGTTVSSVPAGRVPEGTRITVSAMPKPDHEFLGWTSGKTLAMEGEYLTDSLQYSFILKENTTVHANFRRTAEEKKDDFSKPSAIVREGRLMLYNPNGGRLKNSEETIYVSKSFDTYYLMPNTLPAANEIFVRDGYMLTGFSDAPEGGNVYGIGHTARFAEGENAPTYLYCVWEPYSDLSCFAWEDCEGGVTITAYTGNEEKVVVPEHIDGKDVVRLSKGAIHGDNIRTLYLPYTLQSCESGSVTDCPKLTDLYLWDGVTDVPNDAFSDTAVFRTLHLNAARGPSFAAYYRNFAIKYQYLLSLPDDRPKIVVVSGSNSDHGVDTLWMEQQLGGKYYVVNYGTDAAFNVTLYLDCVSHMLSEGDIIVHNFEQMDYVRGTPEINALTFQGLESSYDFLSLADMSAYTNFFGALCEFNTMRSRVGASDYNENPSSHNKRGEKLSIMETYNKDDFHSGANGTFYFNDHVFSEQESGNMSRLYREIRSRGVTVLITYPSFNYNAIAPECRNKESYGAYDRSIRKDFDAPLISRVQDYIFEGKYMSNTDYHLNAYGRAIRTERLLRDLMPYLK